MPRTAPRDPRCVARIRSNSGSGWGQASTPANRLASNRRLHVRSSGWRRSLTRKKRCQREIPSESLAPRRLSPKPRPRNHPKGRPQRGVSPRRRDPSHPPPRRNPVVRRSVERTPRLRRRRRRPQPTACRFRSLGRSLARSLRIVPTRSPTPQLRPFRLTNMKSIRFVPFPRRPTPTTRTVPAPTLYFAVDFTFGRHPRDSLSPRSTLERSRCEWILRHPLRSHRRHRLPCATSSARPTVARR